MWTAEVEQADGQGEEETEDGAPCRTSDTHATIADEDDVEHYIQNGTGQDGYHHQTGVAVGLHKTLQRESQYHGDSAE